MKNPHIFPEINAKVQAQSRLLLKAKYNSEKCEEGIYNELKKIHDTNFQDDTVERYLTSEKHISRRFDSYRGFKFRYINDLVNSNIALSEDFFKREDRQKVQTSDSSEELLVVQEGSSGGGMKKTNEKRPTSSFKMMKRPSTAVRLSSSSYKIQTNTSNKRITISGYKDPGRTSSIFFKRPMTGKLGHRPITGSTRIDSILNEELSFFEKRK